MRVHCWAIIAVYRSNFPTSPKHFHWEIFSCHNGENYQSYGNKEGSVWLRRKILKMASRRKCLGMLEVVNKLWFWIACPIFCCCYSSFDCATWCGVNKALKACSSITQPSMAPLCSRPVWSVRFWRCYWIMLEEKTFQAISFHVCTEKLARDCWLIRLTWLAREKWLYLWLSSFLSFFTVYQALKWLNLRIAASFSHSMKRFKILRNLNTSLANDQWTNVA